MATEGFSSDSALGNDAEQSRFDDDAVLTITGRQANRIMDVVRAGIAMEEFTDYAKATLHLIWEADCFVNLPAEPDENFHAGEHLLHKLTRDSERVNPGSKFSGELSMALGTLSSLKPARVPA